MRLRQKEDSNATATDMLQREFRIEGINPCRSCDEPLVPIADLFAGLATFSCEKYGPFEQWVRMNSGQGTLFQSEGEAGLRLSGSDRERFPVLSELDLICKDRKLGVSLRTH